jgi:hypothetical protein
MPAIYTSFPATGKTVQSPDYETRGLEKRVAARITDLVAVGLPHVRQVAYSSYVTNLSAFLFATAVGKKVLCSQTYFEPKVDLKNLIYFPLPALFVSPRKALKSAEEKTAFAERCQNAEQVKFGTRDVFVIQHPTVDSIITLPYDILDANTPSPVNATSLVGMRGLLTTIKLLTLFLSTHTYPAFQSDVDTTLNNYGFDVDILSTSSSAASKGFRYIKDMIPQYKEELDLDEAGLLKDTGYAGGFKYPDNVEYNTMVEESTFVAKPAPFRPSINVGNPSQIPSLPGYLFPYFEGCLVPEDKSLPTFMAEYLFGSFGATKDLAAKGYETWVTSYDKWYKTETGKKLAHIFLGIRLAVQSQSRLFIITTSNDYSGFALLGFKFSIAIGGKVVEADTAQVLRSMAIKLDEHSKALVEICNVLSRTPTISTKLATVVNPGAFKSLRQLWGAVLRREEIKDDDWEIIEANWEKVTFVEKFWPMTHQRIAEAVSLIFTSDKALDQTLPCAIPVKLLYCKGRVEAVLSVFGPFAPSFIDMKGTEFPIPSPGASDPAAVIDPISGKRALEMILVSGKRLEAACDDFHNLMKKRRIRQNLGERAAGFRTMKFQGHARDLIWEALKLVPRPVDIEGRKRGREEDEDLGEGTSAKKTRIEADIPTFTMDF